MPHRSAALALALTAALAFSPPASAIGALSDTVETAYYATLSQAIAATVTQEATLAAGDGEPFADFGTSVSLSGDRALVGAPGAGGGNGPGAAYVFAFDGAQPDGQQWALEAELTADDLTLAARFGSAVSLDGDRALIGAFADNVDGRFSGTAYVFAFDGASWGEQAKLSDPDFADGFSRGGVALRGDRALVGASGQAGTSQFGAAYVFAFDAAQPDGQQWALEAELTAGDPDAPAEFGSSVAFDGSRALVGALGADGATVGSGAAYVFAFDGSKPAGQRWSQEAKLAAADGAISDVFGTSVSLSGDRALVGADGDDDNGQLSGSAYVFAFDGQQWAQEAKLVAEDGGSFDAFGASVSLDGDRALVGAFRDDDAGTDAGAAYVFAFDGQQWAQQVKFSADDAAAFDFFGTSVALWGGRALVGAPPNSGPGAAYTFALGLALAADAGPDQTVVAGQTVTLDGSASAGADAFAWTLSGGAALAGADTATPSFCAADAVAYTATLTVSGADASASDAVTVTAVSPTDALGALLADVLATAGLSRGQARLLVRDVKTAQRAIDRGLDPAPFLNDFRSRVLGYEADGTIAAAQADALVASADAVLEATGSPCQESSAAPALASASTSGVLGLTAYPNPSSGRTTVTFTVETAGPVRLSVLDALGREVAVLADGPAEAGRHTAELDASAWPAGVYVLRLATADGQAATERITQLR